MPFPIYSTLVKGGGPRVLIRPEDEHLHLRNQFRKLTLIKGIEPEPTREILSLDNVHVARAAVDKLGPLTPPFEEMWIEYDFLDPRSNYDGVPAGIGGAAYVMHYRDTNTVEVASYIVYADKTIVAVSIGMVFELRPDGSAENISFGVRDPKLQHLFDEQVEWKTSWMIIYPIIYTIGLMNCKNVGLKTETYRSRSSSAKARKSEPKLEYHTIVLPQPKARRGEPQGGSHSTPAIHKVRGHFKTYTAERPLLGKHVGTYWWPWQVRGDADRGAILSKYQVKEK